MKVKVTQENLAAGLGIVARAVSTRSLLPVLSNVLLEANDQELRLTTTNMEISLIEVVPAEVEEPGATSVPATLFADLVDAITDGGAVHLATDKGETVKIKSGGFDAHLKSLPADEFPMMRVLPEQPFATLSQKELKRALNETVFAASSHEQAGVLRGIQCRFADATLTLSAADNYRSGLKTVKLANPATETVSMLVPAPGLTELIRLLGDTDDPVEVTVTAQRNEIMFSLPGTFILCRALDGKFPNIERAIPTSFATRVVVNREGLLRVVRPASLIARTGSNVIRVDVGANGSEGLTISSAAEIGDHVGQVAASVEGAPLRLGFNARYLNEILTNVTPDEFAIELGGAMSPVVFRPVDDDSYVHMVAPIKLNQ